MPDASGFVDSDGSDSQDGVDIGDVRLPGELWEARSDWVDALADAGTDEPEDDLSLPKCVISTNKSGPVITYVHAENEKKRLGRQS
eukprot:3628740-Alexandrium_andersonii.AAC.1